MNQPIRAKCRLDGSESGQSTGLESANQGRIQPVFVLKLLSGVLLFPTPWTASGQASLSFIISQSLLKFMSIESVMLSKYLIPCCSLFLLPSIFPSIRAFSSESTLHIRWSFSWFTLGLTGLISLQSKGLSRVFSSTTVQKHQFFGPQLSLWSNFHTPYMTTGKIIALTRQTFVGKVISLPFICCLGLS